ncbi:MAG TPA: RsmB/NOP family class I SAM-dependent RNA methyltransferase [Rhodocyclaceae bacterium]|jgi:16S rRNA (cytosine967-C5)-methyltransferase|nr:RsmB/NOP family class I SAM-dependent RNA methyltransferase [Rhodocyclaceae bacterium]
MSALQINASLLAGARNVVHELLTFDYPADAVLSHHFRNHREVGARDRAFIAETAYAVLRRLRTLEHLCAQSGDRITPQRLVLAALTRIAGYNNRQLAGALDAEEVKWLDALREQTLDAVTPAEQADLPDWLYERLIALMSAEDALTLARGMNQPAPLDLRVNPMKISREDVLDILATEGIEAEACVYAPFGIRLKKKPSLAKHPLFLDGSIEVQDEGSQLLGHLVQPRRGEMVMDFCAGAGGKTLLLGALMRSSGRLYAFDVSDKRLAKLKPRLARSGLSNVHPGVIANENDAKIKRLAGKFDRVLIDAPCSGLGTLRRNPDLKWRQTPEAIAELCQKQASILASASRLVKSGGRLVYATCSILPEENSAIVDAFLATHPEFVRKPVSEVLTQQNIALDTGDDLRLLPHVHGTDGFFAAVLERKA